MRSDLIKEGPSRAPHRSLLRALGIDDLEMKRPFVAVVNSKSDYIPGHMHLDKIAEQVKAGIRNAGGVPFEFNTIGVCDGIAMNHKGMKYSLCSRELIADSIEVMLTAHPLDAIVFIPNCDKIVPGMLLAACRLNLPCIFISGGPMLPGKSAVTGGRIGLSEQFEYVGANAVGKMSDQILESCAYTACPTCGSCSGMYTANSMNCLTETIGMSLPGSGTIPAVMSARLRLAKEAGERVMDLLKEDIKPSDIITEKAIENAMRTDMAIGCSTNTILHLTAIAHAAGHDIDLARLDAYGRKTPQICKLNPASSVFITDLNDVGGIPAVMKELAKGGMINTDCLTVSGTVQDRLDAAPDADGEIIHTLEAPFSADGGIAVLTGNLAEDGAVVKKGAVAPEMMQHKGPAKCYNSEEEAIAAITGGKVVAGDVVVIRYEGPKGGPGMREMFKAMKYMYGVGLSKSAALITDGRFSGTNNGCFVGHISPEAAEGGPLAIVHDGDEILIDVDEGVLELHVSDEEIAERYKTLELPKKNIPNGYLRLYAKVAASADEGAIIKA